MLEILRLTNGGSTLLRNRCGFPRPAAKLSAEVLLHRSVFATACPVLSQGPEGDGGFLLHHWHLVQCSGSPRAHGCYGDSKDELFALLCAHEKALTEISLIHQFEVSLLVVTLCIN